MKRLKAFWTIILFFCLFILNMHSQAYALIIPERLVYDLTWTGIKAGEAVLETRDEGDFIKFISKATSAKWVSVFYHVEDVVVSTLKKDNSYDKRFQGIPYNYRIKLKEGKHRRDKEVIFDQSTKKITYINHLQKERSDFDMKDFILDPLSSLYYVRGVPLEVGKSVFIDIFDSKKLYQVEIQVLKREVIETPLGAFKTVVIKPIMQSEGIFYRKGDILIWLTDDEKRTPVLLKTKVAVGSVNATIVSRHP